MSVKIEILQYKHKQDNNINWSNDANKLIGWTAQSGISITNSGSTNSVKFSSDASAYTGQYNGAFINFPLTNGQTYKLTFNVVGFNNNGQGASNVFILGNSGAGGNNSYRPFGSNPITSGGVQTHTFTVDTSQNNNSDSFRFLIQLTNGDNADKVMRLSDVTLENKTVLDGINWYESVVGELDITDSRNFPLALNFQISDIKDITSTTGDFSKTFKVPATKNNNKLLKHLYIANINTDLLTGGHGADVTASLKCRIIIDGLHAINGLLKVTGVAGFGVEASYYNCIFLGSNLGWADELDGVYLHELDWGNNNKGLLYNYDTVSASWNQEDSDTLADGTSNSNMFVYPIVSHGEYNDGGIENTIQMLKTKFAHDGFNSSQTGYQGLQNAGGGYGTPDPQPDWRPALWVKKTLEKIFHSIGYSIDSTFVNTQMFKQLVWTLPNFKCYNTDEKYADFSADATFDKSVNLSAHQTSVDYAHPTGLSYNVLQYVGFGVGLGALNTQFTYSAVTANTLISYNDAAPTDWTAFNNYNHTIYPGKNATTLATGGGSYFTIEEYGYYNIVLDDCSVHCANLQRNGASIPNHYSSFGAGDQLRSPEWVIESIQYRIQRQSPGQTSWDNIATANDDDPQFNIAGNSGATSTKECYGEFIADVNVGSGGVNDELNEYYPCVDGDASAGGNTIDINDSIDFSVWLNKDDKIRILLQVQQRPKTWTTNWQGTYTISYRPIIGKFSIKLDPSVVEWGQTYDLKDVINPDLKVVDFIKGISHSFNLKLQTNQEQRKVTFEPFSTFYKPFAQAVDFTYKLDRSKLTEDKWQKTELKRNIIFKYKTDDKDKKVESRGIKYFDNVIDEYPYQELLPVTFEKGETVYENPFFAGTYCPVDQQTRGIFTSFLGTPPTACLWEDDISSSSTSRPDKGYEFLPRLLYYNRYDDVTFTATSSDKIKFSFVQDWKDSTFVLSAANSLPFPFNLATQTNIFPHAVSYNREKTTYPVLTYGSVRIREFDDATGNIADSVIGEGLYETYYREMFEMLKSRPRIRTVFIDLNTTDIINLDFRKLIYIDGVYFRLNKIIDYQPNKNIPTKVELIEWLQLGAFAAKAPALDETIIIGTGGSNGTGIPDGGTNNLGA
tara:strand:+ start:178 stop:3552 length:3375 start_codon:yes stop_codon:yes gene_type:complete